MRHSLHIIIYTYSINLLWSTLYTRLIVAQNQHTAEHRGLFFFLLSRIDRIVWRVCSCEKGLLLLLIGEHQNPAKKRGVIVVSVVSVSQVDI